MAIVINGSGTVTGLAVGGLPDGTVDAGTLATNSVDSAELIDGAVDDSHIASIKGRKNIIINGAMAVAQRGTSTTSGAQAYLLDRFYTFSFSATGRTVSQSTDSPAEFSHSLKVQRAANNTATTDVYLSQPIESKNCVGTAGKKVTFSFWAKKGANWSRSSSIFPVSVTSGTGSDQSFMAGVTGGVTLINSSVTLTTSWAKYSFTSSAIVPTNSTQLIYQTISGWAGTAGADDSFYITGIQLETGETATDFEHKSFGEELALCQRYCYKTATGVGNSLYGIGIAWTASSGHIVLQNSVPMRAAPSFTASGSFSILHNQSAINVSVTMQKQTTDFARVDVSGSGFTVNGAFSLRNANDANAYLLLDAEL